MKNGKFPTHLHIYEYMYMYIYPSLEASIVPIGNHPLQLRRGALWANCACGLRGPHSPPGIPLRRAQGSYRRRLNCRLLALYPSSTAAPEGFIRALLPTSPRLTSLQDLTCPCLLPHLPPQWNSRSPSQSGPFSRGSLAWSVLACPSVQSYPHPFLSDLIP